ncbi:squamosa promoter-binding-like protein 7 [Andrographis paniculata]|uniref:squamosa promoter-binding-like protein 7 n=1 Tax=Andrographis paniculata TaxID=175694 RepID=UPI0021E904AE|nr:squamosa promoter-binding-like protein 7 [Andrographis paniculata]XP_051127989.1 squamosa promoter-binding-like protein 7 [Andrographis paniculata]XP_051127990.1 squamosa promoter-binding-like protein 7 [Andrographis paniculata]
MHSNSPPQIPIPASDPTSSSPFDWSDFLDFNLDEVWDASLPQADPGHDPIQPPEIPGRVRKRDPRLVCSNFLAGRVPCACPELDEKLEAEEKESVLPGKKRARTVRILRCQVPGCEADIAELKGYHKRHRVCLQCANASAVVLDGETRRYCQQCGKFHLLSDFDEGKRSCRRKLEWHNRRRRRKSNDSKAGTDNKAPQIILTDDVSGDDDAGKDGILENHRPDEREILLGSEAHVSSETMPSDSFGSFAASGEIPMDVQKQIPKCSPSPACCDANKNTYSSLCPTGRISFKLYDWNPAEFPRRLRLQIFQWLASMPIELEGYIRPGCTILTAFISMPKPMWLKLLKEPTLCIKELVASPGNILSGRGTMLVYLNDMIFRVTKDAKSVSKVTVRDRAPRLHYIYPTSFEAGRNMEFVACGSHLIQPKFRFLVSFSGQYLAYDVSISSSLRCNKSDGSCPDHQLLKITVPLADANRYGPAIIEVENQSGLSNSIPILIGDKEICTEMEMLQWKFDAPLPRPGRSCEILSSRQARFSDFVFDLAWLLKKPASIQQLSPSHILRLNLLLTFLMDKDSYIILDRVVGAAKCAADYDSVDAVGMRSLRMNVAIAQIILDQKYRRKDSMAIFEGTKNISSGVGKFVSSPDTNDAAPFLTNDVVMNMNLETTMRRPRKSCGNVLTRTFSTSRPAVVAVVAAVGICCAVCAAVLHREGVGRIATTIRRCLFDGRRF